MSRTNSLQETETHSSSHSPTSLEDNILSPENGESVPSKGYRFKKQGKWSTEEDELLRRSVTECGEKQWHKICKTIPGRTAIQCLHRWSKILKPGLVKGPWTAEEDFKLMAWVKKHGASQWTKAGEVIQGRSGKQCRERWFNSLNPDVKKGGWTPEEDRLIFELYKANGSSWSKIAKFLPGRSENSVKNRFYSTLRKTNIGSETSWKNEDEKVFSVNVMPQEPVMSKLVEEAQKKDETLSDESKKKQNELYHLLKKSYGDQKIEIGETFKLENLKLDMNKTEGSLMLGQPMKTEIDHTSKENNDLSLNKRYNSCKVGNELDEYEKVQKKMFSLNNNTASLYNATNLPAANMLQAGGLSSGLFGQNLNLGLENSLAANPLLGQIKAQEANLAALRLNAGLLLGLDPLSLNLQASALLGGMQLGGLGAMPLGTRNSNIEKEGQEKKDMKGDYEGMEPKLNGNGLGVKNEIQRLLEAQAQVQAQGQKDFNNLLAMSSMLYNSQLQNLMTNNLALAARGMGMDATNVMMRNPLEVALANNKGLGQNFSFASFQ